MKKKLVLLVLFLLFSFFTLTLGKDLTYWPTNGWKTSAPEEQGMDSGTLAKIFDQIQTDKKGMHSLLIIRHGYIVMEAYFHPYDVNTKHVIASCTKSFNSCMMGIAIKEGYIKSIDQKILTFFPDYQVNNLDDRKKALTLRNLLNMTDGLDWKDAVGNASDVAKGTLDLPIVREPGTVFYYNSGASHILSAVIQRATKMSTFSYAKEKLFKPLGIKNVTWDSDPSGVSFGGWGMMVTPRDMAKLGYLYLKKGYWENKSIVPKKWVEDSTKIHSIRPEDGLGYGFQWWIGPDYYTAHGLNGQYILVVPKYDLIVVSTSPYEDLSIRYIPIILKNYIVPSIKSERNLPPAPEQTAALLKITDKLANPDPKPIPPEPETARKISGHTYTIDGNQFDLLSCRFECKENEYMVTLNYVDHTQEMAVGLDDLFHKTSGENPVYAKGKWKTNTVFTIETRDNGNFTFQFVNDQITIRRTDPESRYTGKLATN